MVLGLTVTDLFGAAMVVAGAVVLLASGRYVWRAGAVIRADAVGSLAGVGPGSLVRLSGTAEPAADTLEAPFSGREALVLRYVVEERRLGPFPVLPWFVTIHERSGSVPFRLRTPEGVVDVPEPTRTVTLSADRVATVGPDEEPPDRVANFERRTEPLPSSTRWRDPPAVLRAPARWLSLGTRRYTEERASPGDEVTVVGRVTEAGGVDPLVVSDRSPGGTLRRMASTSLVGLLIGVFVVVLGVGLFAL